MDAGGLDVADEMGVDVDEARQDGQSPPRSTNVAPSGVPSSGPATATIRPSSPTWSTAIRAGPAGLDVQQTAAPNGDRHWRIRSPCGSKSGSGWSRAGRRRPMISTSKPSPPASASPAPSGRSRGRSIARHSGRTRRT